MSQGTFSNKRLITVMNADSNEASDIGGPRADSSGKSYSQVVRHSKRSWAKSVPFVFGLFSIVTALGEKSVPILTTNREPVRFEVTDFENVCTNIQAIVCRDPFERTSEFQDRLGKFDLSGKQIYLLVEPPFVTVDPYPDEGTYFVRLADTVSPSIYSTNLDFIIASKQAYSKETLFKNGFGATFDGKSSLTYSYSIRITNRSELPMQVLKKGGEDRLQTVLGVPLFNPSPEIIAKLKLGQVSLSVRVSIGALTNIATNSYYQSATAKSPMESAIEGIVLPIRLTGIAVITEDRKEILGKCILVSESQIQKAKSPASITPKQSE